MVIDGLNWMDWLHKKRAEDEEKRIREGVSGAEWLRRVNAEAEAVLAELAEHRQPSVARDRKPNADQP